MKLEELDFESLYQYKDSNFDILCAYSEEMTIHGIYKFKVISVAANNWGSGDLHLYKTHIKNNLIKLS
jgi:hypothetical protein